MQTVLGFPGVLGVVAGEREASRLHKRHELRAEEAHGWRTCEEDASTSRGLSRSLNWLTLRVSANSIVVRRPSNATPQQSGSGPEPTSWTPSPHSRRRRRPPPSAAPTDHIFPRVAFFCIPRTATALHYLSLLVQTCHAVLPSRLLPPPLLFRGAIQLFVVRPISGLLDLSSWEVHFRNRQLAPIVHNAVR